MGILSETKALEKLRRLRSEFSKLVRVGYEHRAKSCATCETPGACCLDEHFVNVNITRLEAVAIDKVIDELPNREDVRRRIDDSIDRYSLTDTGDTFARTYACPLFEKGVGCLVHERAKPLPCIAHACYENKEDLPPDELLAEHEGLVWKLNERAYSSANLLPIPVSIKRHAVRPLTNSAIANPASNQPTN